MRWERSLPFIVNCLKEKINWQQNSYKQHKFSDWVRICSCDKWNAKTWISDNKKTKTRKIILEIIWLEIKSKYKYVFIFNCERNTLIKLEASLLAVKLLNCKFLRRKFVSVSVQRSLFLRDIWGETSLKWFFFQNNFYLKNEKNLDRSTIPTNYFGNGAHQGRWPTL